MKVLVVSFDKSLIKGIKEALKDYEIIDVKNGEEAINTVSTYVDAIVYDAISGSISEEDINNMYQKRFKDAKYIVLVDELFPVDMNNIIVKKKVKLPREEALSRIKEALLEEPKKEELPTALPEIELVSPPLPQIETGYTETPPYEEGRRRVLVVSFDSTLTDTIKATLGTDYDITSVKNVKEAMEKAREADVIIFDTISGVIAQKALMEMSQSEELSQKQYILLIDELFTIDVDSIPLPYKYSFSREAQLGRAIEKARELLKTPPPIEAKPAVEESPPPPQEVSEEVLGLLDELFKEQKEEIPLEPTFEKAEETPPKSEKPLLEPTAIDLSHLEKTLKEHIKEVLSQKVLEEAFKDALQELSMVSSLEKVLKEEINRQLSLIDVASIIREEASKALRERLKELIT